MSLAKVVRTLAAEAGLLEEHARAAGPGQHPESAGRLPQALDAAADGGRRARAVQDPFVTLLLQKSPPSIAVLDEGAVPAAFKRVTLKLPLSAVPPGLLDLVQTCDIDRTAIHDLIKTTGELPPGIYYDERRHLRIR